MATWQDKNGKSWDCEITVKTLKQVKSRLNVDLLDFQNAAKRLMQDVYLLCDVLYIVHSAECEKLGISDEDFGNLLAGDAIDDATKALIDSLCYFFPVQQREMLAKITKKRQEVETEIYKKVGQEIDNIPTEKVLELIQKEFGGSSFNSAVQSA